MLVFLQHLTGQNVRRLHVNKKTPLTLSKMTESLEKQYGM